MTDIETRSRIARAAEARFVEIVGKVERETGVDLPHLKSVQYTIDRTKTTDTGQEPYHRCFPALRSSPYWNLAEIPDPVRPLLSQLETEFSQIRLEFDRGREPELFVDGRTGYFGASEDWRHLLVMRQDVTLTDLARERHPHLCSILDELAALDMARKCYFALLRPGAHLANHCGGTNLFLRLHLGVQIPSGDTGLRVGGKRAVGAKARCCCSTIHSRMRPGTTRRMIATSCCSVLSILTSPETNVPCCRPSTVPSPRAARQKRFRKSYVRNPAIKTSNHPLAASQHNRSQEFYYEIRARYVRRMACGPLDETGRAPCDRPLYVG